MSTAAKIFAAVLLLTLTSLTATAPIAPAPPAASAAAAAVAPSPDLASTLLAGTTANAFPPGCEVPCSGSCCAVLCGGHGGTLAVCVNGRPICRCRP